MRIIAFDCSAGACSTAVVRFDSHGQTEEVEAAESLPMSRGHGEALLPQVERVRTIAEVDWSDIDAIAVSRGPGSFTGVRIALSAAKGLALAANRPAVPVSSLHALAEMVRRSEAHVDISPDQSIPLILSLLDSRRDDVFAQLFSRRTNGIQSESEPFILDPGSPLASEMLKQSGSRLIIVGDIAETAAKSFRESGLSVEGFLEVSAPDPVVLAGLAAATLASGDGGAREQSLSPLYIRPPDAKPPGSPPGTPSG